MRSHVSIEMNPKNKTALVMTLLTLGLFFSKIFVFVTPLPFIYYHLKYRESDSYSVVWPSILVVVAIYMFGVDFFYTIYQTHPFTLWLIPIPVIELAKYFTLTTVQIFGITYFGVYLVMSYLISRALISPTQKVFPRLFWSLVGIFVVTGLLTFVLIYPQSELIVSAYRQYVDAGMLQIIEAQEKAGLALEQIVYLKSQISKVADYSFFMMPFIFLTSLSTLFVINLIIAKRFFLLTYKGLEKINLNEFKVPFFVVWIAVGLAVVMIVNEKFIGWEPLFYTTLNLLLSLGIAYFLQGLAISIHFLNQKKIVGLSRLVIYFFLIFFVLFMMHAMVLIFATLGFFDNWMDIRKLDKKAETPRKRDDSKKF